MSPSLNLFLQAQGSLPLLEPCVIESCRTPYGGAIYVLERHIRARGEVLNWVAKYHGRKQP